MEITQINVLGQTYNIKDAFGRALIASEYNPSSSYGIGDLVQYSGLLYSCVSSTTGDWISNNWSQTYITDMLGSGGKQPLSIDWDLIYSLHNKTISGSFYCEIDELYTNILRSCPNLTEISCPNCLQIQRYACAGNPNLSSVNFPKCNIIQDDVFYGCSSLQSINFPVCTTIGSWAFYYCTSLQSANFPVCTFIGSTAFNQCVSLSAIYLLASSVCTLTNTNAFYLTPMSLSSYLGYFGSIYVPSSLVDAYKTATNWVTYSNRITAYVGD